MRQRGHTSASARGSTKKMRNPLHSSARPGDTAAANLRMAAASPAWRIEAGTTPHVMAVARPVARPWQPPLPLHPCHLADSLKRLQLHLLYQGALSLQPLRSLIAP